MQLINLPRLRLNELQTLAEKSVKLCNEIKEVEPAVKNTDDTLTTFKDAMQKDKSTGLDKKTQDKNRDIDINGFFDQVTVEKAYPENSPEVAEQLTELSLILNKYSKSIIRLPYSEESAAIDNLMAEITSKINLAILNPAVTRWIPLIEKENQKFKDLDETSDEKKSVIKSNHSATKVAPYLVTALEGLFTLLFAHTQISGNEKIKDTYIQLSNLVDAYRQ